MGLSRKREQSNLTTLRTELNRLNMGQTTNVNEPDGGRPTAGCNKLTEGTGALIKEAKKRGRRKDQLIDGSKLLTST